MNKQAAYRVLRNTATLEDIQVVAKDYLKLFGAVEEVNRALKNGGPLPDPSRTVEKRHRTEWPSLWAAIDTLRELV